MLKLPILFRGGFKSPPLLVGLISLLTPFFSDNGLTIAVGDVEAETGIIKNLRILVNEDNDVFKSIQQSGEEYRTFGHVYITELNLIFYAAELKTTTIEG